VQPPQADRRTAGAQQELLHLAPDAFRRKITKVYRSTEVNRFRINSEFKAGCQLRGSQHSQTIFCKSFCRNCAQDSTLNVFPSIKRIDNLPG
jgi:hypothetical protein